MKMQKLDRIQNTVSILMLVFFITSVTVAGCLSLPSSTKNKFTDIAYATKSDTQKLDIYLPNEENGPFPVIIAFHSGGFTAGNNNRKYSPDASGLKSWLCSSTC